MNRPSQITKFITSAIPPALACLAVLGFQRLVLADCEQTSSAQGLVQAARDLQGAVKDSAPGHQGNILEKRACLEKTIRGTKELLDGREAAEALYALALTEYALGRNLGQAVLYLCSMRVASMNFRPEMRYLITETHPLYSHLYGSEQCPDIPYLRVDQRSRTNGVHDGVLYGSPAKIPYIIQHLRDHNAVESTALVKVNGSDDVPPCERERGKVEVKNYIGEPMRRLKARPDRYGVWAHIGTVPSGTVVHVTAIGLHKTGKVAPFNNEVYPSGHAVKTGKRVSGYRDSFLIAPYLTGGAFVIKEQPVRAVGDGDVNTYAEIRWTTPSRGAVRMEGTYTATEDANLFVGMNEWRRNDNNPDERLYLEYEFCR